MITTSLIDSWDDMHGCNLIIKPGDLVQIIQTSVLSFISLDPNIEAKVGDVILVVSLHPNGTYTEIIDNEMIEFRNILRYRCSKDRTQAIPIQDVIKVSKI